MTQKMNLHMDITRCNTEIRIIMFFFAAKDGEVLYSQQKQDLGLIVAEIMRALLQNSGIN